MWRTVYLINLLWMFFAMASCSQRRSSLPYFDTPDFTPRFLTPADADKKITHTVGAFSCVDQNGRPFTDEQVRGKIHVANFMFTRCGSICPVMTKNMKALEAAFDADPEIEILSFSVTPWIDSVARLHDFAAQYDIHAPNRHLLTGDKAQIYSLARTSYFAEEELGFQKDSTEFLHTEHVMLVDHKGRIRGVYNGTLSLHIKQLIADIRVLKNEVR